MMEKSKQVHPPRGLARLAWRAPIWLYRLGLGWLLGKRFVLINHVGRKTGKVRQAVVEVVYHEPETDSYILASGFGEKSDWYQNLTAYPQVMVQVGRRRKWVCAKRLPQSRATEVLLEYNHQHPALLRTLAGMLGYPMDGSEESVRFFASQIPMVALVTDRPVKGG
jgi:deazaflavin-dependent oxidoreductase (nitroreductase family)